MLGMYEQANDELGQVRTISTHPALRSGTEEAYLAGATLPRVA